jgi:hypothetical protein
LKESKFLDVTKISLLKGRLSNTVWFIAGGVAKVKFGEILIPV